MPRTWVGWALAGLMALFAASTAAYAAGGIPDVLDYVFGDTVPYVQDHKLGTEVDEKMSRDGVTVTIDRSYADSAYVVLGFHVDGLDKLGGAGDDILADVGLSDPVARSGAKDLAMTDGFWTSWVPAGEAAPGIPRTPKGSQVGTVVFQSPTGLEPGENKRLRAEVSLFRMPSRKPTVPPFVFDLKTAVSSAPVIRVDQTVEKNGVPVTLTRVVNSPARSYAFLCFDPPEGKYDLPAVETGLFGLRGGHLADVPANHPDDVGGAAAEGCATYNFGETLSDKPGTHRLTITKLVSSDSSEKGSVEGPWRFSFEVPSP